MKRPTRGDTAAVAMPIALTSFFAKIWLFSHYFSIRPTQPDRALGLVWPLNNHGAVVYVTAVESTGLELLFYVFMVGLVLVAAFVPRRYEILPDGPPQWHRYVRAKTDPLEPRQMWIMAFSTLAYLAFLWGFGSSIAGFVVAEGLVLHT